MNRFLNQLQSPLVILALVIAWAATGVDAALGVAFIGALTNAGRDLIAAAVIGDSYTALNNANAYLGVGDSATAFNAAQTDLQAASNKFRKAMQATYPQRATNILTFRSLFATGDANFAWAEWGTFNAAAAGTMFSRKVEALGTKTSAQSWQLTADLTVTAA